MKLTERDVKMLLMIGRGNSAGAIVRKLGITQPQVSIRARYLDRELGGILAQKDYDRQPLRFNERGKKLMPALYGLEVAYDRFRRDLRCY